MHIHILGICGTFMAGIATIARELGHKVTGSDQNIYPPMSTFLERAEIDLIQGYDPKQLDPKPDLVIIGNAMSRGNPCVEYILNHGLHYTSAPQWLHDHVLNDRWVIAVAGTHGKTTTASMINWILERSGYDHGFVIGGIPGNFDVPARLGSAPFFVIEADEYDTAFFDKRSKFVHYAPRTLILNNLEFDHADIFEDLAAIQRQFHHLLRIVPSEGLVITPENDNNLQAVLEKGIFSQQQLIHSKTGWSTRSLNSEASHFQVLLAEEIVGEVRYALVGEHNQHNALMAIAAAHHAGVPIDVACQALSDFINTKRRLELYDTVGRIEIYDDFAHHPTAFTATLTALRSKVGANRRILAVFEPRSNTMKLGSMRDKIAPAMAEADALFALQPASLPWHVRDIAEKAQQPLFWANETAELAAQIAEYAQDDDLILVMSNGGFNGIHQQIKENLLQKS